jgi:transcriptional antiterminator NusG
MRWYVVNVYAGFEQKIADAIRESAEKKGLSEDFGEILIPTEEVIEIKRGQRTTSERKFFPGYILVEMNLTDDTWHLVRSIPRVSMFLGGRGKPSPISAREVQKIRESIADNAAHLSEAITFEIGDSVRVCDGPFATFNGVIEEVDHTKNRLKVSVSIFGRPTNVDLSFSQVEKII